MTISVLISVYKKDEAKFLDKAISSIWTEQTLKPNKLVLVEDGPISDDLRFIIDKWKNEIGENMTIIRHEINQGLTKSLNDGINIIDTDLIARMDSDDISCPNRFKQQVDFLENNPHIDIVGGSLQEFNEDSDCINIRHYPSTHEEVVNTMHKICPLAHPTVMMRKRIFDNGLRYNEKYRNSQDIALWFDAVCAGFKIANLQEVTILFRFASNVYSRRSKAKALNEFRIYTNGIYRLYGLFTTKYIYPVIRLFFRMMPIRIVKWGYKSKLRKKVTGDNKQSKEN